MVKLIPKEIRNVDWPEVDFLSQEQQQAYEQVCKQYSGKARDSLNVSRNGSNLFKILLLNQEGITTLTLPQLEDAIENGLNLSDFYIDGREIILRSAKEDPHTPNDYLAKNLAEQLEITEFEYPYVVQGLKIKQDNNFSYGLRFKKTAKTEVFEAPDLNHWNNGKRFSRINPDYSIVWDENGTRTLYTRNDSLSGLCWMGQGLGSNYRDLTSSDPSGRVVVVSAEGTQKNLDKFFLQLQQEREAQATELQEKFDKAMGILRGQS